jgi:hypothetical protein
MSRATQQLYLVIELLGFGCGELLLSEACRWGRGYFGNQEEEERPLLKPLPSNGSEDVTVDSWVCNNEL